MYKGWWLYYHVTVYSCSDRVFPIIHHYLWIALPELIVGYKAFYLYKLSIILQEHIDYFVLYKIISNRNCHEYRNESKLDINGNFLLILVTTLNSQSKYRWFCQSMLSCLIFIPITRIWHTLFNFWNDQFRPP